MKGFSSNLSKALVPDHYLYVDNIVEGDVCIVCRGRDYLISRQMIAIAKLETQKLTTQFIEKIRQQIKKKYNGFYVFREIGLQIVVLANNFSQSDLDVLKADKYATSAIIIQGLHIVSIEQKTVSSVNSQWGEITFGKGKEINSLLLKLISD